MLKNWFRRRNVVDKRTTRRLDLGNTTIALRDVFTEQRCCAREFLSRLVINIKNMVDIEYPKYIDKKLVAWDEDYIGKQMEKYMSDIQKMLRKISYNYDGYHCRVISTPNGDPYKFEDGKPIYWGYKCYIDFTIDTDLISRSDIFEIYKSDGMVYFKHISHDMDIFIRDKLGQCKEGFPIYHGIPLLHKSITCVYEYLIEKLDERLYEK